MRKILEPMRIGAGFSIRKAMDEGYDMRQGAYAANGLDFYRRIEAIAEGNPLPNEGFFTRALDSTTATSGEEMIPENWSAQIIKYLYENNWFRQYFATWPMRAITEHIPKITSDFFPDYHDTAYSGDASTDYLVESTPTTGEITLTLKTISVRWILDNKHISYNVNRSGIIGIYKDMIQRKVAAVEEDVIVNGDTTASTSNINYTYDATNHPHGYDTTHNYWLIATNGIRKSAAGTAVDAGGDAFTLADVRSILKNLGIYGRDRKKVAIIVSPDVALTMMSWDELETFDQYGAGATIFHGEIGRVKPYGVTVIETDKMPNSTSDTLTDSTGTRSNTLGNNLYTECAGCYQDAVLLGVPVYPERLLNIKTLDKSDQDRQELVAVEDLAVGFPYTAGIVRCYNIL